MNFTLRPHTDTDVPALLAVIRAAFAQYRGRIDPPSSAEHKTVEIVRAELAQADAVVAEADGRIVGCVFYRPVTNDWGTSMYIDRLAVHPDARGQGLADRLLAEAERATRARGLAAMMLSVRIPLTELHAFYRKRGFEAVGTTTHAGYAQPTSMVFRKSVIRDP
jgi:predicted N-acetyltransferase YhbS